MSEAYVRQDLSTIGSDNGLSPGRRQAIFWTSSVLLLIGFFVTKLSEILIEIYTFSFNECIGKCLM